MNTGSPISPNTPSGPVPSIWTQVEYGSVWPALLAALVTGYLIGRGRRERLKEGPAAACAVAAAGPDAPREAVPSDTLFCPVCRAEFVGGTETCEDCGVELVQEEDLPVDDRPIEEGIVRVCRLRSMVQGQLMSAYLAANHIPCTVNRCAFSDALPVDLYVFESQALAAKKLFLAYFPGAERTRA